MNHAGGKYRNSNENAILRLFGGEHEKVQYDRIAVACPPAYAPDGQSVSLDTQTSYEHVEGELEPVRNSRPSMNLYLLRHGIAEESGLRVSDAQRALTDEGKRKLKQVLAAALEAKVLPSLILSSPLKRTMQTAEIAADILRFKGEILQAPMLKPGTTVEQVWDEVRLYKDEASLLLVGHNPTFSQLAGYLLGYPNMQVDFKKGALMKVELTSFPPNPRGALHWYLTAKLASHRD